MSGGPPAKKMKPEESLVPESTFLRQNPPTGNDLKLSLILNLESKSRRTRVPNSLSQVPV